MTDILHKLEDKVIRLVDELEALRSKLTAMVKENQDLRAENAVLKGQSETEQEKIRGILNLLDGVEKEITVPASDTVTTHA